MKMIALAVSALAFIVAAGCNSGSDTLAPDQDSASDPSGSGKPTGTPGEDVTVTLKFDQPTIVPSEQLEIAWLNVGDSRCAEGVTCFWEGQVSVTLGVLKDGQDLGSFDITLHVGDEDQAMASAGGCNIHLRDVAPYPKYGVEPDRSDYVATLLIDPQ